MGKIDFGGGICYISVLFYSRENSIRPEGKITMASNEKLEFESRDCDLESEEWEVNSYEWKNPVVNWNTPQGDRQVKSGCSTGILVLLVLVVGLLVAGCEQGEGWEEKVDQRIDQRLAADFDMLTSDQRVKLVEQQEKLEKLKRSVENELELIGNNNINNKELDGKQTQAIEEHGDQINILFEGKDVLKEKTELNTIKIGELEKAIEKQDQVLQQIVGKFNQHVRRSTHFDPQPDPVGDGNEPPGPPPEPPVDLPPPPAEAEQDLFETPPATAPGEYPIPEYPEAPAPSSPLEEEEKSVVVRPVPFLGGTIRPQSRAVVAVPSTTALESAWIAYVADRWEGEQEYLLIDDSRVDVYEETSCRGPCAWEVERASKWKEGVGQALFYKIMTGGEAGVCLLTFENDKDKNFILRCKITCEKAGLRLVTVDERGEIR